jgi:hypothetical protein
MSSSPESKPNDADISPSPEPGIKRFRWSAVQVKAVSYPTSKSGAWTESNTKKLWDARTAGTESELRNQTDVRSI